jgi:putative transcriptional regulator
MIQFRLKELMARKERLEQHRVTYAVITERTRISPSTLSRMANSELDMVGLSVIDRLCEFFPCTPGELMVRVDGQSTNVEGQA